MQCMNAARNWLQIHSSSQLHKDLSSSYKFGDHENMRQDAVMLQECGCMMFTQNGLQEKSHDKLLTVSRLGIHLKLLRSLFF